MNKKFIINENVVKAITETEYSNDIKPISAESLSNAEPYVHTSVYTVEGVICPENSGDDEQGVPPKRIYSEDEMYFESGIGEMAANAFEGLLSVERLSEYAIPLGEVLWDYVIQVTSEDLAYADGDYIVNLIGDICGTYSCPQNRDQYIVPLISISDEGYFEALILISYMSVPDDGYASDASDASDAGCKFMKLHHSFSHYAEVFNVRGYGNSPSIPISFCQAEELVDIMLCARPYFVVPDLHSIHYKNFECLITSPLNS